MIVARAWLAVAAGALVLAAGAAVFLVAQPPLTSTVHYADGAAMAERIGCRDTYRTVVLGSAVSAGECTTSDGVRVRLRVYRTEGEAKAWLDGASGPRGLDPQTGTTVSGDGWAALLTGGDAPAQASLVSTLAQRSS